MRDALRAPRTGGTGPGLTRPPSPLRAPRPRAGCPLTRPFGDFRDQFDQNLSGHLFEPGASITVGGTPIGGVQEASTFLRRFLGPSLAPGGVYDITLTNPSGLSGTLENGYVSRFSDIIPQSLYDAFISRLVAAEVTAGCGGGNYCQNAPVTREQMAVFLLRGNRGACCVPPPATGTVFSDVPLNGFAPWIEELFHSQITGGCGVGLYCPGSPVTREQMALFILRTLEGPAYFPPPCSTATFGDVPCSSPFASWIYEFSRRGNTAGCGNGNYCPFDTLSRGQMAVFIAAAFGLR